MCEAPRPISRETARRMAVTKQHLAGGKGRRSGRHDLMSVMRDIAYVQIDTFATVASTQAITLWSRVEGFRMEDLDHRLWAEKTLFETPPEPTSIALLEDYPLHYSLMKRDPRAHSGWWGGKRERGRAWLERHADLVESILHQLQGAELTLDQFEEHVPAGQRIDGWTSGSEVSLTLGFLHVEGQVMVVGREGNQKVWGLPEDFLPDRVDRRVVPEEDLEARCAERAIRALGTANSSDIYYYFPRGRYVNLKGALRQLEAAGAILPVKITEGEVRETRYVHEQDLKLLDEIESGKWEPRVALLAPYDNLMAGRDRTRRLFEFDYTHGNYLPVSKRKYGVFVLPILWGDRVVGRLDPKFDRTTGTLVVHSIHAEPGGPREPAVGEGIRTVVNGLADLVGARDVRYPSKIPAPWKRELA